MGDSNHAYGRISTSSSDEAHILMLKEHEGGCTDSSNGERKLAVVFRHFKLLTFILIPVAILTLIIMGGLLLNRTSTPTISQVTISTRIPPDFCGSTPSQAEKAGCLFEANNFAWQHPLCYNAEHEEDWRHGPWSSDLEFWKEHDDEWNGVGRIPNEEAFTGQIQSVWVNTLQHRRHCLFMWRKYVESAVNQLPMDSWTAFPPHVDHCTDLIRDFDDLWPDTKVSSTLSLKYPACEYGPIAIDISPNDWRPEQIDPHSPESMFRGST